MQGWMSFQCSGSNDLTNALSRASAVEFFISQLPDDKIGNAALELTSLDRLAANVALMHAGDLSFITTKPSSMITS